MKASYWIIFLLSIGILLRTYNLFWGSPFFFHPDERNIIYAVQRLNFPHQLNPQFFAYGSLPLYTIYFTTMAWNKLFNILHTSGTDIQITTVSFENALFIGRLYSAIFSFFLILLLVKVGRKISTSNYFIAVLLLLSTTSVGLIQFAHFATLEIWLSFFSVLLFYFLHQYISIKKKRYLFISGIVFGLLLSIKISSLIMLPAVFFAILLGYPYKKPQEKIRYVAQVFKSFSTHGLISITLAGAICILTSPYFFLDFSSFQSSIRYESDVATGILPVFYTGQFFNTIPILFQFFKIYPFIINPFLTVLFIPSIAYVTYAAIKHKNSSYLLLLTFYLLLFIPQAFLFVKWTRYMIPTLPFMYLIISLSLTNFLVFLNKKTSSKIFLLTQRVVFISLLLICLTFSLSYFFSVERQEDSRIAASTWAKENISSQATIISEVYDLGIIPFNQNFPNIVLLNFYDLEDNPAESSRLYDLLKKTDYIILPSQRILKNRILNRDKFPAGNTFYANLAANKLKFKKIYETPCDIFCKILYLGNPVFNTEETATVFDRPTVFIYKNEKL